MCRALSRPMCLQCHEPPSAPHWTMTKMPMSYSALARSQVEHAVVEPRRRRLLRQQLAVHLVRVAHFAGLGGVDRLVATAEQYRHSPHPVRHRPLVRHGLSQTPPLGVDNPPPHVCRMLICDHTPCEQHRGDRAAAIRDHRQTARLIREMEVLQHCQRQRPIRSRVHSCWRAACDVATTDRCDR